MINKLRAALSARPAAPMLDTIAASAAVSLALYVVHSVLQKRAESLAGLDQAIRDRQADLTVLDAQVRARVEVMRQLDAMEVPEGGHEPRGFEDPRDTMDSSGDLADAAPAPFVVEGRS